MKTEEQEITRNVKTMPQYLISRIPIFVQEENASKMD